MSSRRKVMIVGKGGREHALALSFSLSPQVSELYCCPGNPGISQIAHCSPIPEDDFSRLADFAIAKKIDLVVVGPDDPLGAGIVDYLEGRDIRVFGPRKDAAKLEWSKYFAKEFMLRRKIPTSRYAAFEERDYALAYAKSRSLPVVVKADGLARGKGVTVAGTYELATSAIEACFDGKYGEAGRRVVIEDHVPGWEASVFAVCDGKRYALLPTSQDFKALYDDEQGPKTGGMGACSPHPKMTTEQLVRVKREILEPTLAGMAEEGRPYKGFLYVGLIFDEHDNPHVLEFNSRLGDPESQVILPLLECDLLDVLWDATEGDLAHYGGIVPNTEASDSPGAAVCVILASQGYPEEVASGLPIRFKIGLSLGANCQLIDQSGDIDHDKAKIVLFHGGTKLDANRNLLTEGGRVLGVTALAADMESAREAVYIATKKIDFAGKTYRSDIAKPPEEVSEGSVDIALPSSDT